jgi:hypothetical protein
LLTVPVSVPGVRGVFPNLLIKTCIR